MPIYEYRCNDCKKQFEYMQRMSEDAKTVCEECSGALERLISASAFHLKGGGWYKDLYASAKPEAKSGDSSGSGDSGDSGGSSDSSDSSSKDSSSSSESSSSSSDSSSSSSSESSSSSSKAASSGTSGSDS